MGSVLFSKLTVEFDISQLVDECLNLSQGDWVAHVNQQGFAGRWDVCALRVPKVHASGHPILQSFAIGQHQDWLDLDVLRQSPAIRHLLSHLNAPVKSVRLMRLHPDSSILPHRDRGLSLEQGEVRLHVPITGAEGVSFQVEGYEVPMQKGEVWYINADREHQVVNCGNQARINLVIDCQVTPRLSEQILSCAAPQAREQT